MSALRSRTSRTAAFAMRVATRSVAVLLVWLYLLAGTALADTPASCTTTSSDATSYCQAITPGNVEEGTLLAGVGGGLILSAGVGSIVGIGALYRKIARL
jgi:hypothetical protein